MNKNYIVYLGDEARYATSDLEKAKKEYDKLPSGEGKRPGLRRSLVEEIVIYEDKR
jgi:hypothetical protein